VIRGYMSSMGEQLSGKPITLPHDVDIQAYARSQEDFTQWLMKNLSNSKAVGTVEPKTGVIAPKANEGRLEELKNTERFAGGLRRPASYQLSQEEIEHLTQEFIKIGGDPKALRFNKGTQTDYVDKSDKINVRGDVMPLEDANHPRSTMTTRAVLAHERGHQDHRDTKVPVGDWNDEFRASYWAAKNVPNLTLEERASLIQDAILRAQEAGVPIRNNAFMNKILYGYEE
jgi:hypothetical protein